MSNGTPPIQPAPVPPSIAGIPQPVYGSGSATVPAAGPITGTPIIPPPTIGNPDGFPVFPPVGPNTAPVPVPRRPARRPRGWASAGPALDPRRHAAAIPDREPDGPTRLFPLVHHHPAVAADRVRQHLQDRRYPAAAALDARPEPAASHPFAVPTIPQLPWNPPPTQPPPLNTVRPAITGTTVTGSNLTSTTGTWTHATTYARAWLRNGSPIAGATAAVYALVGADEGTLISVNVTATGPGGETSMESLSVGPITAPPLADEERRRPGESSPPATRQLIMRANRSESGKMAHACRLHQRSPKPSE